MEIWSKAGKDLRLVTSKTIRTALFKAGEAVGGDKEDIDRARKILIKVKVRDHLYVNFDMFVIPRSEQAWTQWLAAQMDESLKDKCCHYPPVGGYHKIVTETLRTDMLRSAIIAFSKQGVSHCLISLEY
jgi:hypothetical protein